MLTRVAAPRRLRRSQRHYAWRRGSAAYIGTGPGSVRPVRQRLAVSHGNAAW